MIILLGGSGYVGSEFRKVLSQWGIPFSILSRVETDNYNPLVLDKYIKENNCDFLINCAGYTGKPNVDACEADQHNCYYANVVLPYNIDKVCQTHGLKWGHVSSGCIFQGNNNGEGFSETDVPNFMFDAGKLSGKCSFYSGTKALGEQMLGYSNVNGQWVNNNPSGYIWRLRIPFNARVNDRNYITKLLSYEKLLDVENSLSHLREFVEACLYSWQMGLPLGIYNVTNPGSVTTRQITDYITTQKDCLKSFNFFDDEQEFHNLVAAPRSSCVLDSSKITNYGVKMRPVFEAVKWAIDMYGEHENYGT